MRAGRENKTTPQSLEIFFQLSLTYNYSYAIIKLIKGVAACYGAVSPGSFETALLQGGRLFLVV
jgi:hypothetical protein